MSLRRPLDQWKYTRYLKSGRSQPLNELPAIQEFTYWNLVEAGFKHNRHHTEHLMLVLKRPHCDIWNITNNEIYELWREIFPALDNNYHYVKINLKQMRSIHGYVHIHVLNLKRRYQ